MAITDSLGGALAYQGKPDSFVGEAMNNARYARAEEERKRREQAKKDEDAADKYQNIISKLKVEGYDPIYNDEIKRRAGKVIGILNDGYKKNKFSDPYNNQEFTKELQDFQIFSDEAKQATKALSDDYTLTTGGKKTLKPELAAALQSNDYQAYQKALGGTKHYRRGAGIDNVEEQFDYIGFKSKVGSAYKPFDKTYEYQDPKTGNFVTVENQYYQDPIRATTEVLASDPKAGEFFAAQFSSLPVSKQKEYSVKAQSQGGSGMAYVEFAKDRLFPDAGTKSKTTIQEQSSTGQNSATPKISATYDITPDGKHVLGFQRKDVTENKPLTFTVGDEIIEGIPLRFERIGKQPPVLIVKTVTKNRRGDMITETREIPYDEASRKIKNEYGFTYTDIETNTPPKNVELTDYTKYENKKPAQSEVKEVERSVNGRTAIFDETTKKFIRWKQ